MKYKNSEIVVLIIILITIVILSFSNIHISIYFGELPKGSEYESVKVVRYKGQ